MQLSFFERPKVKIKYYRHRNGVVAVIANGWWSSIGRTKKSATESVLRKFHKEIYEQE